MSRSPRRWATATDRVTEVHPRAAEFRDRAAERYGLTVVVEEFPDGTSTAADAAAALGCSVGRIASSLVFVADDDPVVVVASGANRVDEDRLADLCDADRVATADPDRVRAVTGWAIGGVPPICHERDPPVLLDRSLLGYETVYAAAGTPATVFEVDPDRLRRLADARPVDVAD